MYYDRPPLKAPVWTWEIPAYFFTGGAAGGAALIAAIANLSGADADLVRHARWIAAGGAAISPVLLISDLGRPSRFLNMLRVFKLQSPMSVGAWTLVAFSAAVFTLVAFDWWGAAHASRVVRAAIGAAEVMSALTGLLLATYTGVLIGATAIPAWSSHVRLLPILFGASGLGAAVSLVELMGHWTDPLNFAGIGAAAIETMVSLRMGLTRRARRDGSPSGSSTLLLRTGEFLAGFVPLVLRVVASHSPTLRLLTATLTIIGSLVTRFGWIALGRQSAGDPRSL